MLETPTKNKNIQDFTSPIGLLKKYSSTHTQGGQFSNTKNNNYEDQFFKIKAQRLQTQLQEIKQQNNILRSKVSDSATNLQILREKLYTMENSQQKSSSQTERNRPGQNGEVEKLLKEIRILKNEHQIQMVKVQDQNRKLKRKILQVTTNGLKTEPEEEGQREERKIRHEAHEKVLEQNQSLRKDIKAEIIKREAIQQKLETSNLEKQRLSKQIEQLKTIMSAKNRYQQKYNNLLQKYEVQSNQLQNYLQLNRQSLEKSTGEFQIGRTNNFKTQDKEFGSRMRSEIGRSEVEQQQNTIRDLRNKIKMLQVKSQQQNALVSQKNEEIANILQKLKPLLQKGANPSKIQENKDRASLSMLQIFLKKYKIASF